MEFHSDGQQDEWAFFGAMVFSWLLLRCWWHASIYSTTTTSFQGLYVSTGYRYILGPVWMVFMKYTVILLESKRRKGDIAMGKSRVLNYSLASWICSAHGFSSSVRLLCVLIGQRYDVLSGWRTHFVPSAR
jgi:hypothetical protein